MSFKSKLETIYNIPITRADTHCDLGILLVSSNFSWEPHYQHIIAKSFKLLGLLRHTFSTHNTINSKKQLYISLVRSQLLYCPVLRTLHLIKHIHLFEQVQCRATKFTLNDFTSNYKICLL